MRRPTESGRPVRRAGASITPAVSVLSAPEATPRTEPRDPTAGTARETDSHTNAPEFDAPTSAAASDAQGPLTDSQ
jgi:hypothetical protein